MEWKLPQINNRFRIDTYHNKCLLTNEHKPCIRFLTNHFTYIFLLNFHISLTNRGSSHPYFMITELSHGEIIEVRKWHSQIQEAGLSISNPLFLPILLIQGILLGDKIWFYFFIYPHSANLPRTHNILWEQGGVRRGIYSY